jgi:hypothetical protein
METLYKTLEEVIKKMSGKKFLAGLTAFLAVMLMTTAAMAATLKYTPERQDNTWTVVSGDYADINIEVTSGDNWPPATDLEHIMIAASKYDQPTSSAITARGLDITLSQPVNNNIASINIRGGANSIGSDDLTIYGYGTDPTQEIASRDLILRVVSEDAYSARLYDQQIETQQIEIPQNHMGTTSFDVRFYRTSYATGSPVETNVTDTFPLSEMHIYSGSSTIDAVSWNNLIFTVSSADRQIGMSGTPVTAGTDNQAFFTLGVNSVSGDLSLPFSIRVVDAEPWDREITDIEFPQYWYRVPVGVRILKAVTFTTTPAVDSLSSAGYRATLSQSQWNNLQLEVDPAYNFVLISGVPRAAATGQEFTLTASRSGKPSLTDDFWIEAVQHNTPGSSLRPQRETVISDKDGRIRDSMTIGEDNTLLFPLNGGVSNMTVTFTDSTGSVGYLVDVTELGFEAANNARRAFGEGAFMLTGNNVRILFTPGVPGTHYFQFYYTAPNGVAYVESRSAPSDSRSDGGGGGGCAAGSGLAGVAALAALAVIRRRG